MKITIEIDIDSPALENISTDEAISRILDHTACALYSAIKDRKPFYRSMHNREGQLYGHAILAGSKSQHKRIDACTSQ